MLLSFSRLRILIGRIRRRRLIRIYIRLGDVLTEWTAKVLILRSVI